MAITKRFGIALVGIFALSLASSPSLQAQTRVTLESLQTQINTLNTRIAALEAENAQLIALIEEQLEQNQVIAGQGLTKSGNVISLADGGVTASKIAPGSITAGHLSGPIDASTLQGHPASNFLSRSGGTLNGDLYIDGDLVVSGNTGLGIEPTQQRLSILGSVRLSEVLILSQYPFSPVAGTAENMGAMYFNTQVGRPVFNDGSNWQTIGVE